MSPKDKREKNGEDDTSQTSFGRQSRNVRDFFSIPQPVKKLFDQVPVVTYPPNQLPQRAPRPARIPSLYVFSKEEDAAAGKPSFNPSCLKWQVSGSESCTAE
jgi:metaxin